MHSDYWMERHKAALRLPNVGKRLRMPVSYGKDRPSKEGWHWGRVVYVDRNRLWYTVRFDGLGFCESYGGSV